MHSSDDGANSDVMDVMMDRGRGIKEHSRP